MGDRFRALAFVLRTALAVDRWRTLATIAATVVQAAGQVASPFFLKVILDGVVDGTATTAVLGAVGFGGATAVQGVADSARTTWGMVLREKTAFELDRRTAEVSAAMVTIEHHERAEYQDELLLLRTQRDSVAGAIQQFVWNLLQALQLVGLVLLLAVVHPALLVLPVFAVPSLLLTARSVDRVQRAMEATAETRRRADHLFGVSTNPGAGKEIRVFGIAVRLLLEHRRLWTDYDRRIRAAAVRALGFSVTGWVIFGVGYAACLLFVVNAAVRNPEATTVGDVLLAFVGAAQVNLFLTQTAASSALLLGILRTVGRLIWIWKYSEEAAASAIATGRGPVPEALTDGIRAEGLGFTYPGTDRPVLRDVSFHLRPGSVVAIVGENGAGKTTLVKLLCRLYEPTSGTITVDGVPLRDLDVEQWRARITGCFQDYARFELVARESIGLGNVAVVEDVAAVERGVERGGAGPLVQSLPQGLDTPLGRTMPGGVELSGGQWQTVALSRMMMRATPLLLVLDEPTAALDAEAEDALYRRYAEASSTAGAITILVTHRFSTVRSADAIIVLDQGRIVETGSHDALLAKGGTYAEIFELQAKAYR